MITRSSSITTVLAMFFCMLLGAAAHAQASRTWVSGVGDDANPCSRTAPCKTFAGAISKTAAGGEIDVLDPGGFGAVSVTKSITIDGSVASTAGVLVAGTNGITVSDSGAGTAVVTLRNLDFEGLGFTGTGTGVRGISFLSGAALQVENVTIRNFRDTTNGAGIFIAPSTAAKVSIVDSVVTGNGTNSGNTTQGGIVIEPSASVAVMVSIDDVTMENNSLGIRADTTSAPSGSIFLAISDSESTNNLFGGITAFTPSGGTANSSHVTMEINSSTITGIGTGLNANGPGSTMRVGMSVVAGNATGAQIQNGATLTSYGDNQISDNTVAGATIPIARPS
jgi:hypothetical protein